VRLFAPGSWRRGTLWTCQGVSSLPSPTVTASTASSGHEAALEKAQHALELDPDFPPAYLVIADVDPQRRQPEKAVAAARRMAKIDPSWEWFAGRVYALAGRRAEAREILTRLRAQKVTPWSAFGLAALYGALGDRDEAFRWLNYEHPHAWVPWVRVLPWFEPLWNDARLPALLAKMHLPPLRPS
jgi:hypothetical protein